MTSSLVACLQSRRRQEAVIPISCLRHSPGGRRHNGGVKEKSHICICFFFSCLESFFLPRTSQKIHCDCARECFARADEKRLQWHRNHICTNVNSDHDKAVVVETLMMGLLVSGLVWLKVKQRKTKGTFPNYKHPSYHQGVGLFLYILYIIGV